MRLIREICEYIKDAHGKYVSVQEIDRIAKAKLQGAIESEEFRTDEVLEALTQLVLPLEKFVARHKAKASGNGQASSTTTSNKGSGVTEQLFNLRSAHAKRFFRTIALRNAHSVQHNPAPAHLPAHAAQLRYMQSALRGMRTALCVANERIAELRSEVEMGVQSGVSARLAHARTQLDRLLHARREGVRQIVRLRLENMEYMLKLNQARQLMGEIVLLHVSPTKTELSGGRDSFAFNAKLEIETLGKIDVISELPAVLGRTKDTREDGIMSAIKASSDSGPEALLQKIFATKVQLEGAIQLFNYERQLLDSALAGIPHVTKNDTNAISNLVKQNDAFMERHRQIALQQQNLQLEAAQTVNKVLAVRHEADSWWQQPAQYEVPWVTLEGKQLDSFTDEWRSMCAVLENL